MRNYAFTPDERPTMSAFNQRFESIEDLANGIGNEYVWAKTLSESIYSIGEEQSETITLTFSVDVPMNYSKEFQYDEKTGSYSLVNPSSASGSGGIGDRLASGMYIKFSSTKDNEIYYRNTSVYSYSSGNVTATFLRYFREVDITPEGTIIGYVNSPDPTAYPPAEDDGYAYTALGKLGSKVQIATGSYLGTGAYGASNPNSLTFDFEPKVVIVMADSIQGYAVYFINPSKMFSNSASGNVTWAGNTIYFYSTSADNQLNVSGKLFDYIGVG